LRNSLVRMNSYGCKSALPCWLIQN